MQSLGCSSHRADSLYASMGFRRWTCELLGEKNALCTHNVRFIFLCVMSAAMCVAAGLYIRLAKKSKRPPGPRGLPIIGHLHLLGGNPHKSLFNLSKVHGPLMWLRFGSVPVIVASTPQAARLILQTNDQVFAGRPCSVAAVSLTHDCTDIAFSPPNSYWKLMRQICVADLVNNKRMEGFKPIRETEACKLVRAIAKEILEINSATSRADNMVAVAGAHESIMKKRGTPAHETSAIQENANMDGADFMQKITKSGMPGTAVPPVTVSVRKKLLQASNNMISRMVFGRTLSEIIGSPLHVGSSLNLLELLDELLQCLSIFNLGDLIPAIAWMDLQGVRRRSCAVARKLDIVLQEIVDSRCHRKPSSNVSPVREEDLLDILLSLSSKHTQITDNNIKAFIQDMFIGGTDTSAYTIEWALAELLANPLEMKVVQEEIDNVVGRERVVQESDLAHLPYLRAVVNESMRLHPILPFLIPHVATQQCKLLDFDVPANTQAYVNVWAVGRDADAWEEPLVFKPQRFLNGSTVSMGVQCFELLPFGAGRRGCPGWALGLLSVQLQLASLLQGFYWLAPPNFDIQDKFGIMTTKAKPLAALASPKLPPHLYFINDAGA